MNPQRWVHVTLPIGHTFTYALPDTITPQNPIGYRAVVLLSNRLTIGIITKIVKQPPYTTKAIVQLPDDKPFLSPKYLSFLHWITTYYLYPLPQLIRKAILPIKAWCAINITLIKPLKKLHLTSAAEKKWLENLAQAPMAYSQACQYLPHKNLIVSINHLLKQKAIILCKPNYTEVDALTLLQEPKPNTLPPTITTPAQKKLWDTYHALVKKTKNKTIPYPLLLNHGISAITLTRAKKNPVWSIKTLPTPPIMRSLPSDLPQLTAQQKIISKTIKLSQWQEKKVAYLSILPDQEKVLYTTFALTTIQQKESNLIIFPTLEALKYWEKQLKKIIGPQLIVWSSHIKKEIKAKEWFALKKSTPRLIIATPHILLYPLATLNRIILADETSPHHKQPTAPTYHARDLAIACAQHYNAHILLSSIIPTLATYHNLQKGKYTTLTFPQQKTKKKPTLSILMRTRAHPIITPPLIDTLEKTYNKDGQVIVLYPRRGYTTHTFCTQCHWQARCPSCDKALVYHQNTTYLQCHHCKAKAPIPSTCPQCHTAQLQYAHVGTQHIAQTLAQLPHARIAQIDSDHKGYQATIKQFQQKKINTLIGTQKLVSALPFLNPRLILWIDPHRWSVPTHLNPITRQRYLFEKLLHHPTAEKLLVLTTQQQQNSLVLLQKKLKVLYDYILTQAKENDYPPYTKLIKIIFSHHHTSPMHVAEKLANVLTSEYQIHTLGPTPLPATPDKKQKQVALWIKIYDQKTKATLHAYLKTLMKKYKDQKIACQFDVDP